MPPVPSTVWDWVDPHAITVVSTLLFFIIGLISKWWVMGYQLADMKTERDEARAERDEWKTMALKNFALAEKSTREAMATIRGKEGAA